MNDTVAMILAEGIAALARGVPTPVSPLGYGADLSCWNDVSPMLEEVDPNSVMGIAQAQFRRLTTARGRLAYDPDYGYDVRALANAAITRGEVVAQAGMIRAECLKDDRIAECTVTLQATRRGDRIAIEIRNTPENPALRTFTHVIAVTDGKALWEGLNGLT
jgi:hypothetical protein